MAVSHNGDGSGSRSTTYSSLGHQVQKNIEPSREKLFTSLGQVQAADAAEFDAETLQEDGKDV
jgi:hypothetical protein